MAPKRQNLNKKISTLEFLYDELNIKLRNANDAHQLKIAEISSLKDIIINLKKDQNKKEFEHFKSKQSMNKMPREFKVPDTKVSDVQVYN